MKSYAASPRSILTLLNCLLGPALYWLPPNATSQTVSSLSVPYDGPKQMPVLYTHGFNDDGAAWGMGDLSGSAGSIASLSNFRARYQTNTETAVALFNRHGIETYAVQWTAATPDVYSDAFATADQGFAFLADQAQLRLETDWVGGTRALHNRARPGFMETLQTPSMDVVLPAYAPFEAALIGAWSPIPVPPSVIQAGRKTFYLAMIGNINNYNDSGRVEDHATDLLDLLRNEREPGGRLAAYRQVNILTHSKGSLVSRALLHKANQASREDAEYVANVIYNAPPFAGSSLTEILKMFYDPIVFTRADLANPWMAQTLDEVKDGLLGESELPNPRLGDLIRAVWQTLCDPFGYDFSVIENQVPLVKNNLDLLNVFSIEAFTLSAMANAPINTTAAQAGELVAVIANAVRPVVAFAIGIPSFPTARVDLTPQGGADFLQNYQNTDHAAQYVNIGTSSPFNAQHMLWPEAGLAAVAADPSLLTDPAVQQGQVSDTYVAAPSAELLTATDAFGPRMRLGGFYPTDHGGITLRFDLMATHWMSIYLAPPTTMHLNGTIAVLSDVDRVYSVSTATTLSFTSANFLREVEGNTLFIEAREHQFRFVPLYASNPDPSPWETLSPGSTRTVGDALADHGMPEAAVRIQWRAINQAGGQEMIRAATLVPVGDPPGIASTDILGVSSEIAQRDVRRIGVGLAARSTFFQRLPLRAADYSLITSLPEPDWIIRNQAAKALVVVFDKPGSVDYAWNDPALGSPATMQNVNALFLVLDQLGDGPQTLTFQTYSEAGGLERRGPVRTLRLFVDNRPPEHALAGLEPGAISFRVGPSTPLQYRAEDLETGGAQGTLTIVGYNNLEVPAGSTFTLGDTDLVEQLRALPGGEDLPGALISLLAVARDRVNNTASTNLQAYYDFTAPLITNVTVAGALPSGPGVIVFTNRVTLSVDLKDDAGSEVMPPCAAYQNLETQQAACSAPFTLQGFVGAGFARYTGSVELVEGDNLIRVVAQDVFGNLGSAVVHIESSQTPPAEDANLIVLTPRLDNVNSLYYDDSGQATNFNDGAISDVAVSADGRRFLFVSTGNGFVYGDSNARGDVFLTEAGRIRRVSTGPNGEQANDASDSPAISGNGRYAYFSSDATNLATNTAQVNLYVKDLETGDIAVISRHFDGSPINRFAGTFETAATDNGRYVFFATRNASYVENLTDANTGPDIYMVDLDPDGNGDYFDDNYATTAISRSAPDRTGNGQSFYPSVSGDGRYLLFLTQATDITPDLALNGSTLDALLLKFSGDANTGNLNVSSPAYYVVNRSSVAGGGTTDFGVHRAAVAPDGDTVVFSTRSNVEFSGDNNLESNGHDVYSSIGETFGTASISNRVIAWQSRGVGNAPSSTPSTTAPRLTVARFRPPAAFHNNKLAWLSTHTNLVPDDVNGLQDLFVATAGGLGVSPMSPPSPNWISDSLPSAQIISDGGLTPDGRHAWWVTAQSYTAPYGLDRSHLYLRRLDPPLTNTLTLIASGRGRITADPAGSIPSPGVHAYLDTETAEVTLEAVPDSFNRFTGWIGVDSSDGATAVVRLDGDRTVTGSFAAARIPVVAPLAMVLDEDTVSDPAWPDIQDADAGDVHTLSIVAPPAHGAVTLTPSGFVYTPVENYSGADAFRFQVTDLYGLTARDPVDASIQVNPVNDPPAVQSQVKLTLGDGVFGPVLPAFSDPDPSDRHVFDIVSQPVHGRAIARAEGLYYDPSAGFVGTDAFTYRITDSAGASATGVLQVEVAPVPSLTGAEAVRDGFLIRVDDLPAGVGYTVEFKEKLNLEDWRPVPPEDQWPSTRRSFFDPRLHPSRFYRLRFEFLE